jgi:hypothetical protein
MSEKFDIYSKIFYRDVKKFVRYLCVLVLRHQMQVSNYFVNSFYSEGNGILVSLPKHLARATETVTYPNPPSPAKIRSALQLRGPSQAPSCLYLSYFSLL